MTNIGFDQNTAEGPKSKFIVVSPETAISAGRYVTELTTGNMDDGKAWLQCVITDNTGATANKRWFEPTMGQYITTEEDLKRAQTKIIGIVANLVRRFKGEEYVMTGATTFKEFFDKAVAAIKSTPNWDKEEIQVLVVNGKPTADGGVFPTLPNFPPIFDDVNSDKPKLSISDKYHDVKAWEGSAVTPDNDGASESLEKISF